MTKELQKRITLEDWRPYNTDFGDFKIVSVENDITFRVPSFLNRDAVLILMDSGWEVVVVEGSREEHMD